MTSEKCPVCGISIFAEVHVPLGGGMTMYVHYADLDKATDRRILEDMQSRLKEQGGEENDEARSRLDGVLLDLPPDQHVLSDSFLLISGCYVPCEEVPDGD